MDKMLARSRFVNKDLPLLGMVMLYQWAACRQLIGYHADFTDSLWIIVEGQLRSRSDLDSAFGHAHASRSRRG